MARYQRVPRPQRARSFTARGQVPRWPRIVMDTPRSSDKPTVCPSREELMAFSAGMFSDALLDAVAEHLSSCPRCEATLHALAQGQPTILSDLRRNVTHEPFLDEPECAQLEAYAK